MQRKTHIIPTKKIKYKGKKKSLKDYKILKFRVVMATGWGVTAAMVQVEGVTSDEE